LKKSEAVELSGWPVDIFDQKVADGVYPRPLVVVTEGRSRPVIRFDRKALEAALDREAGISPQFVGEDPDKLLEDWANEDQDSARQTS
jgi:hypothetical protein